MFPVIPVNGLRDDAAKGVKRGRYRMAGRDLVNIFAPVVNEIIRLVQSQIDIGVLQPHAILLVGGFGANSYLREELKKAFPRVKLMQPANGWTAVARGALTKAMAGASTDLCKVNITARVARMHYGTNAGVKFEEDIHDSWRKYWSDFYGRHQILVNNWLVAKGDVLKESESVTSDFQIAQICTDGPFTRHQTQFYSFTDGVPPMYKDHNVKHLVTLTSDLSTIPTTDYHISTGHDGENYHWITFQIKLTFLSALIEFSLWHEGKCYGSVMAEYA